MWSFKKDIYRTRRDNCPNCDPNNIDIYGQVWTGCNLDVTTYSDGVTVIPEITDDYQWEIATTGAWCHYDNNPANDAIYGKLYNWYAVVGIYDEASLLDPLLRKQLAPTGYHVPSEAEWLVLRDNLGGGLIAGGKMKEEGFCHWINPNTDATNTSLFTALPGGQRDQLGPYNYIGENGIWWTTTEDDIYPGFARAMFLVNYNGLFGGGDNIKRTGCSVRLIEDTIDPCPDCVEQNIPIGTQVWTRCNATVSTYRDGILIPYVENNNAWSALTTGAWCYYNNDPSTETTYGKLYNWHAINNTTNGGIAPAGWKVPTDAEWTILTDYLGGEIVAGGKMKEEGFCHWDAPNLYATNSSLFTGLPGGQRDYGGTYNFMGYYGYWWSSTENDAYNAWGRVLNFTNGNASRGSGFKRAGLSVRFIQETCLDVTIGTQVWTSCNLNVDRYRDGTLIPEVTDPTGWAGLTTGAWCWYNNDSANGPVYGKLYNWYAVNNTANGGLAPAGYHVPSDTEWTTLTTTLGGNAAAGGAMKETGFTHWQTPNIGATNTSLFTGLPGGFRNGFNGNNNNIGDNGYWWSSTEDNTNYAWSRNLFYNDGNAYRNLINKRNGYSVRLIQD